MAGTLNVVRDEQDSGNHGEIEVVRGEQNSGNQRDIKVVRDEQPEEVMMMQVNMYQDLEEIKPGGFARFGKRNILVILAALAVSIPLIWVMMHILHMDVRIAAQFGAFSIAPIAYFGMFRKKGMTYAEFQRKKRQMNKRYDYMPEIRESGVITDVSKQNRNRWFQAK